MLGSAAQRWTACENRTTKSCPTSKRCERSATRNCVLCECLVLAANIRAANTFGPPSFQALPLAGDMVGWIEIGVSVRTAHRVPVLLASTPLGDSTHVSDDIRMERFVAGSSRHCERAGRLLTGLQRPGQLDRRYVATQAAAVSATNRTAGGRGQGLHRITRTAADNSAREELYRHRCRDQHCDCSTTACAGRHFARPPSSAGEVHDHWPDPQGLVAPAHSGNVERNGKTRVTRAESQRGLVGSLLAFSCMLQRVVSFGTTSAHGLTAVVPGDDRPSGVLASCLEVSMPRTVWLWPVLGCCIARRAPSLGYAGSMFMAATVLPDRCLATSVQAVGAVAASTPYCLGISLGILAITPPWAQCADLASAYPRTSCAPQLQAAHVMSIHSAVPATEASGKAWLLGSCSRRAAHRAPRNSSAQILAAQARGA